MTYTNIKKSVVIDGSGESVELSVCAENVNKDKCEKILNEMEVFEDCLQKILEERAEFGERNGAEG